MTCTFAVGDEPRHWKPPATVGPGVREIRVKVRDQYRVLYVIKKGEVIHVLHGFVKKRSARVKLTLISHVSDTKRFELTSGERHG